MLSRLLIKIEILFILPTLKAAKVRIIYSDSFKIIFKAYLMKINYFNLRCNNKFSAIIYK